MLLNPKRKRGFLQEMKIVDSNGYIKEIPDEQANNWLNNRWIRGTDFMIQNNKIYDFSLSRKERRKREKQNKKNFRIIKKAED